MDTEKQQLGIGDLQVFKAMPKIDVSKHEGKRVKIEQLEIIDSFSSYDEDGDFVAGLKRPVKKLKVLSEVIEEIPRDGADPIKIRASELMPLSKRKVAGNDVWGVSESPNSKIYKFLKKQKVNTIDELKGTLITVVVRQSTDPDDDREWLGFAL